MAAVASRDEAALRWFFDLYHPGVFRYMLCLTANREDAEDLAQDSMLRAAAQIRSFRGESLLKTWVHRIAYRTFTHWNRKRRRLVELPEEALMKEGAYDAVEARLTFLEALGQMPAQLVHTFVMLEVSGMSVEEIAEAMSIPEGTVKSRLFAARRRLRTLLQEEVEEKSHAHCP